MIDLRNLRNNPEGVIQAIERRGEDRGALDEVLALDVQQREVAAERDEIRNQIRNLSQEVGDLHKDGRGDEATKLQEQSRELGKIEETLNDKADQIAEEIKNILLQLDTKFS